MKLGEGTTPGPWKYTLNVGPTQAIICEPDGSTVVHIYNNTHSSKFSAYVRLIAKAPLLLECRDVLQAITDNYERQDQSVNDFHVNIGEFIYHTKKLLAKLES